jgi:hypothetical protein
MTFEERRNATQTVLAWITESCGSKSADFWAWEMTPMPCGLPSDEQLEDGLQMALFVPPRERSEDKTWQQHLMGT